MIFLPFIAAITQATGILIDKIVLSKQKFGHRPFIVLLFFFLWLFTAPLIFFIGKVNFSYPFGIEFLALFFLMIILAFGWNIFYYQGLEKERVQDFELIIMLHPLVTILLASLILPIERQEPVLIASLIASFALILAHLKKAHLVFDIYSLRLIFGIILMGLEIIVIKTLLIIFSPASLYFFRTGLLFILFGIIWLEKMKNLSPKGINLIILTAFLGMIQMVLRFYGYRDLGIIYTTLILTLSPILVYLATLLILKERLQKRVVFAAGVILGCIIYASLVK